MDDSGRDGDEEIMFDIIRSLSPDNEPQDDGSQYLNNSGEGIFEEEPRDEGQTNNDGEENVLQLTKSRKVYIYILGLW